MKERYQKLYTSKQINQRIGQLASEITAKYNGDDSIYGDNPLFVALLRGGAPFASKLMFEITRQAPDFNPEIDYMMTSRYANSIVPNAETKIIMDLAPDTVVQDRNIIIVDDVLDMGETATTVRDHVLNMGARYVELATLVEKDVPRTTTITADYVGFKAPNAWLVGMGMDEGALTKESYRWNSSIWMINPEQNQPQPAITKQ